MEEVLIGFVLGISGSLAAAFGWEWLTRPNLLVQVDTSGRAQGQSPGQAPHEFYNLVVRNRPTISFLRLQRPAWSCRATVEVVADDAGSGRIGPIGARWTSHPEPLAVVGTATGVVAVPDVVRILAAQRVDIHGQEDQEMSVAVKHEGKDGCYLFTNESYGFADWSRPEWRIGIGRHRLRVRLRYEKGVIESHFWLYNRGKGRNDVTLEPIAR
jgi:hypothetical protein